MSIGGGGCNLMPKAWSMQEKQKKQDFMNSENVLISKGSYIRQRSPIWNVQRNLKEQQQKQKQTIQI